VTLFQIWLTGLMTVSAMMVLTWVVSVAVRDASLVDRVWGMAFAVATWTYAVNGGVWNVRTYLVLTLVTVWGVRLSVYITLRNRSHGEDKRYRAMRARNPRWFPLRSLHTIYLLQGLLAWIVSMPLLAATTTSAPVQLTWWDAAGVALWTIGFVFEAGGDWQLSRFLADPANRGRTMDQGLWRYTRHPNYFGDTVVWLGHLCFAAAVGAWWAAFGVLLMIFLIMRVSGVALTERVMGEARNRREGHAEYVARTNRFFPGPPRSTPRRSRRAGASRSAVDPAGPDGRSVSDRRG
jgi:steroid 5-alpha reductase family enzyme